MRVRREFIAVFAVLAIFSIGVLGYIAFSAGKPDGLESAMKNGGVSKQQPIYNAPFNYGRGYFGYLATGIIGFFAVLLISLVIAKLMAKRNEA